MNGVKFIRENGGLARRLPGSDYISGLIVYGEKAIEKALILSVDELETMGVNAQENPVLFYHVSEFFRINAGAKLYIQTLLESDDDFADVKSLQNFADGTIRQLAVCDFKRPMTALVTAVAQLNAIAVELSAFNTPLSILLSPKVTTEDMTSLVDLHALKAERVAVVIGQDGAGFGNELATKNLSIGCVGAALGAISKANVHESIAWVEKQDLVSIAYPKTLTASDSSARELDKIAFADGSLLSKYTSQQIQAINDKGYLFLIKHTGIVGTYFNDSYTATSLEDDFAYIENNRTVDKAIREINRVLLPRISGPAYIDPDTGLLAAATTNALEALCDEVLDQMARDGEVSGFDVQIDPNQKVLRNSKLEVVLKIIPVGTLREIRVKIGLTLKKD